MHKKAQGSSLDRFHRICDRDDGDRKKVMNGKRTIPIILEWPI